MSNEPRAADFSAILAELGLGNPAAVQEVIAEAARTSRPVLEIARERDLLTLDEAEIVTMLLRRAEAIPGYEILSLLGRGGMGAVFRARQKNLDRVVALKTVLLSRGVSPVALARFEREAVTLARLNHPHVVAAYDFGRHDGKVFLALEWVAGEDGERFSRRVGPMEEPLAWALLRQAAAGLAYAAQQGIIHRDVKPANLLLVTPPAGFPLPPGVPLVKLADFGLALLADSDDEQTRLTSAGMTLGSPCYMAPEQWSGETPDQRADMYALGATAYQFLAGQPPFAGLPLSAVIGQKLSTGPKPLAELRAGLSSASLRLVERLLARAPADRFASYDELLADLAAVSDVGSASHRVSLAATAVTQLLPVQPTNATGPSVPTPHDQRPDGRPSRRTAVLTTAVALGVMSFALLGWWALQPEDIAPEPYDPAAFGQEESLYDGTSLTGWSNIAGEWNPTEDNEGAAVLAGTDGEITCYLPQPSVAKGEIISGYRVTLVLRRRQAERVRIEFEPAASAARGQFGTSLILTRDNVARILPVPRGKSHPPIAFGDLVSVQIIRGLRQWTILVDDHTAATLPVARTAVAPPHIRVTVEGGPALFSDLSVAYRVDEKPTAAK